MKKRVIIREYDLKKMPKSITNRYDLKFTPFTKDFFQKRVVWYGLKGKGYLARQYLHYEYPEGLLKRMTGFTMHDQNYRRWLVKYDDEGQLQIRSGLKQPESRLGFVTFREKQHDTVD